MAYLRLFMMGRTFLVLGSIILLLVAIKNSSPYMKDVKHQIINKRHLMSMGSKLLSYTDPKTKITKTVTKPMTIQELYESDGNFQISRQYKIVYTHIPKCGGSTIEKSSLFNDKREMTGKSAGGHSPIWKAMYHKKERQLDNGDFVTATTIRHPISRFVSAFYYSKYGPPNSSPKHPYYQHAQYFLGDVDTVEQFVTKLNQNPQMWNELTGNGNGRGESRTSEHKIPHFLPMAPFVTYPEDRSFGSDVVMCQDQWREGLHRLEQKIGRTLPRDLFVKQLNTYHHTRHHSEEDWRYLSESTQISILKHYAIDSCLFYYGPQYQEELAQLVGLPLESLSSSCIGSLLTRDQFTSRFRQCTLYNIEISKL